MTPELRELLADIDLLLLDTIHTHIYDVDDEIPDDNIYDVMRRRIAAALGEEGPPVVSPA